MDVAMSEGSTPKQLPPAQATRTVVGTGAKTTDWGVDLEFTFALEKLFAGISDQGQDCYKADLIKFLYSDALVHKFRMTGSELAERLFMGGDPNYRMPMNETRLIERNEPTISGLASENTRLVSLGCGPYGPVLTKDLPFVRMISASSYTAVDINPMQARRAADLVADRRGIPTDFISCDFTKPFNLDPTVKGQTTVLSMFGCTLCQFSPWGESAGVGSLSKLLKNISTSTKGNGILVATVDSNQDPRGAECEYLGSDMQRFMEHIWWRAQSLIGDPNFNPDAIRYRPRFDASGKGVVHSYMTEEPFSVTMGKKTYHIPRGRVINMGYSLRYKPEDVDEVARSSGWEPLRPAVDYDSTIRLVALCGKRTPAGIRRHIQQICG